MTDLEERLSTLLSAPPSVEHNPRLLDEVLQRRDQLIRSRRLRLLAPTLLVVAAAAVLIAALGTAGSGPAGRPAVTPAASLSPETQLALTIARPAASGAHVTQAAYIVAAPKAVESVLFPGEDNLQRLIPKGHQMLMIKLAGTFHRDRGGPARPPTYPQANPVYTSLTMFCDAQTGQCVSTALAGGPTPDVVSDLARFGAPVVLTGL